MMVYIYIYPACEYIPLIIDSNVAVWADHNRLHCGGKTETWEDHNKTC